MEPLGTVEVRLSFWHGKVYSNAMINPKLTMIYWKSKKFWLGRLIEHPEIMTQGRTLKELEENLREAYQLMILDDVPEDYAVKEITV
jgi:predicted RNase H-like HicB family nuclease